MAVPSDRWPGGKKNSFGRSVGAGRASGITLGQVRDAIRGRNRDVSAGDVELGKRRYLLRTVGRFTDIDAARRS